MRIFAIADTHFGHEALSGRLNTRPNDFDKRIMKNWRASVAKEDLVIHLGDIAVGKKEHWINFLPDLPGRKILLIGNHDKRSYAWCMKNGFVFVCSLFKWQRFGLDIVFSHEPLSEGNYDLNIHGHQHFPNRHCVIDKRRSYLVSLELNGYRPEKLETIVRSWRIRNDFEVYPQE